MPAELLEKPDTETANYDVSKIKSLVAEAVEDSVHSAKQAIKGARHVAEDLVEEAQHTVKQRPFQTVGIVFAAGILTGGILSWVALKSRR
ncbi:MAG TPA: hypothetical protein VMP68_30015 [Candidatus Eisenbacteria bacterium]|nr:hypothetical protein [Candidatus Eisenbacteria bacterium]